MNRWFLVALAIAFFVCLAQAVPVQDEKTAAQQLEDEISKLGKVIKEALENIQKEPKIEESIKSVQEWAQNAAKKIQEEASKLIPKTEGAAA